METIPQQEPDKTKYLNVGLQICLFLAILSYAVNYLLRGQSEISTSFLSLIGIIVGAILSLQIVKVPKEARAAQEKVQQAEDRLEKDPGESRFAWDLARATLETYFHRNLSQINWIFWLSLAVMFAGFGIIVYGISQTVALTHELAVRPNTEKTSFEAIKTLPATFSTVAGLITEFIGATFLFIYRSTIQQATNYSQTLERINSIGMAMQIFETMPDAVGKDDLKSYTKAKTIELLVRGAYEQSARLPKSPDPNINRRKTKKAVEDDKKSP